jgi:SAM-dependent methyltransferase
MVGRQKRVLELGAASGHVTKALKSLGNHVVAVERDGRFLDELTQVADQVHITDLDWLDLRNLLTEQRFDVILAGDVLEHCTRPDLVLLQCHSLLAAGGYVVVSLPNIAHADVRLALLTGKFEYRPTGLLDQTHLRFFTRATIEKFVAENGFGIDEIHASTTPLGTTEFGPPDTNIPRETIEFVQNDRDSSVYQYVLKIRPVSTPPVHDVAQPRELTQERLLAELSLAQDALAFTKLQLGDAIRSEDLRNELQTARDELQIARDELTSTKVRLNERTADLERSQSENHDLLMRNLHARDATIGLSAELGTMKAKYESAQALADSVIHQLNLLHTSRTWRIGRFMLIPLRSLRWIMKKLLS